MQTSAVDLTKVKRAVVRLVEGRSELTMQDAASLAKAFSIPVKQVKRYINNYILNTHILKGTEMERGTAYPRRERHIFCNSFYNDKAGKKMLIQAGLHAFNIF